jgi:hypothetical protein
MHTPTESGLPQARPRDVAVGKITAIRIQKMDVGGDGGRREFGLRGQRRGTGSDKGTAGAISVSLEDILQGFLVDTLRHCSQQVWFFIPRA